MSEENDVAGQRERHINDFNRADADAMGELMCEDCVTMPPHQSPIGGKEATVAWIREGMAAARTHMDASPNDLVVTGDYAIDRFTWTQNITPAGGGDPATDSGNCIWVWRRETDGQWRLWRSLWNSDQQAQNIWTGASR